jgi:ubiquinone/menaquinone biosynthesis C-methylase UbiE
MVNFSRENKIRKDVVGFYDAVAGRFSQTRKNWWESLDFFKKYINDKDKLLDFGCGNGRLLEFVYNEDLRVDYTGVDVSAQLIEIAQSKYKNEKFLIIGNEGEVPFGEGYFDTIFSIAVFHHFNPGMAKGALGEMRRVLKKDGVVIITAWHLWNKKRIPFLVKAFFRKIIRLDFSKTADLPFSYSDKKEGQKTYWRTCHWWSKRSLEKLARKNGFEVLESGYSRDLRNNKRNIYWVLKKKN